MHLIQVSDRVINLDKLHWANFHPANDVDQEESLIVLWFSVDDYAELVGVEAERLWQFILTHVDQTLCASRGSVTEPVTEKTSVFAALKAV